MLHRFNPIMSPLLSSGRQCELHLVNKDAVSDYLALSCTMSVSLFIFLKMFLCVSLASVSTAIIDYTTFGKR